MGITLANNAHTTLSADASSTDTVIYVEDIDSFPSLDVGDYFYLTLERTSGAQEIVKVTQINASSFNVVRGQESTIPISFSIGSMAKLNMTVQNITDLIVTGSNVNDEAYGTSWDGDTNDAPSRNTVYDKIEMLLPSASYTAADVLSKLLTVDGIGSGLDADLLDGNSSAYFLPATTYTAADVLSKLLTVDGAGSLLDADLLDGYEATAFAQLSGATFSGDVTIGGGDLIVGSTKFAGVANLTLKYDNAVGYSGRLIWERDGTTKWYAQSGSSGSWSLRNNGLGTDAVSFASASNNATFTGTVTVPDDAYAAGWDGNLTTPTKNAVYDKIQSLATLADGDKGDITVSASGATWTIDNSTVTLAKMANMATASLIYRKTAGTGAPEVNTLATLKTDLGLTGTNSGDQTITLTGNVTGSGTGSFATTIANNAVTLAKMATMATDSILGRSTAATGNVEVLTALPFAFTGDVTRAADSNAQTIANDAVTYAKMQNVSAQYKILGRSTAGAGDVEELSTSANMVSLIASADYSTARTNLGLAIGTNVQAYSAILAALAASSNITGTITVSTSAPSGGSSGDVWYERAA